MAQREQTALCPGVVERQGVFLRGKSFTRVPQHQGYIPWDCQCREIPSSSAGTSCEPAGPSPPEPQSCLGSQTGLQNHSLMAM